MRARREAVSGGGQGELGLNPAQPPQPSRGETAGVWPAVWHLWGWGGGGGRGGGSGGVGGPGSEAGPPATCLRPRQSINLAVTSDWNPARATEVRSGVNGTLLVGGGSGGIGGLKMHKC